MAPLVFTVSVTDTFFSCFEQLFLCFTQFGSSTRCLNFVRFHDTAPLSSLMTFGEGLYKEGGDRDLRKCRNRLLFPASL